MRRVIHTYHITRAIPVLLTACLLTVVQLKVDRPIILLERFLPGGGWVEIVLLSVYAGYLYRKMSDVGQSARWRRISWNVFTIVFFAQLTIGLLGVEQFLMSGKLHFPIPAMILAGPIYRMQIGFMPLLFLSTILISGPAWCSHLCYFGALDNQVAAGKRKAMPLSYKNSMKHTVIAMLIVATILLRVLHIPIAYASALAGSFGVAGLLIILVISSKRKKMVHCTSYCPIGTITMYLKHLSPFRMYIQSACDSCMACTVHCPYDALGRQDIAAGKPGLTCTYCGDCLRSCPKQAITYRFLNLSPAAARNLYLVLTITLHVTFLGIARI